MAHRYPRASSFPALSGVGVVWAREVRRISPHTHLVSTISRLIGHLQVL